MRAIVTASLKMRSRVFPRFSPALRLCFFIPAPEPNKAPEPTPTSVTPRASSRAMKLKRRIGDRVPARGAPDAVVAHLERWAMIERSTMVTSGSEWQPWRWCVAMPGIVQADAVSTFTGRRGEGRQARAPDYRIPAFVRGLPRITALWMPRCRTFVQKKFASCSSR
jgi:hypothetical protein